MRFIVCCLFFLPHLLSAHLQDDINSLIQTNPFSGVVFIASDDQILVSKCCGSNIHVESQFLIGSLSKQITAACILQAAASGLIDLDAPICRYLPDQKTKANVRHLLNHSSGIGNTKMRKKPGETFAYSNLGYDLLGKILEKVHNKSYEEIVNQLVTERNMHHTVAPQSGSLRDLQTAYPELIIGSCGDCEKRQACHNPSGGIISTAKDLHHWNMCLHHQLLNTSLYAEMINSQVKRQHRYGDVGYGLQITHDDDVFEISHSGLIPGYKSTMLYYPEYKLSVIILENEAPEEHFERTFSMHDAIRDVVRKDLLLSSCHWGGIFMDLESSSILWSRHAENVFIPASVTKIFTAAAALNILEPSFLFYTKVYADSIIKDQVQGNLYLAGGCDPLLTSDQLKSLAQKVYDVGIRSIYGTVLVDTSLLHHCLPKHGEWEDLVTNYSQEQSALSINDNVITLVVVPNSNKSGPASIEIEEEVPYCKCICQVETVKDLVKPKLSFSRGLENNHFTVHGTIGLLPVREKVAIHDPMEYGRKIFLKYLREIGIQVIENHVEEGNRILITQMSSSSLPSMINHMNAVSHNLTADIFYKYMSKKFLKDPFKYLMSQLNIDKRYAFYDGSGLSRHNLISPLHTVKLLSFFAKHPDFVNSLPLVKLQNTNIKGVKVFAKSGSMSGISNLAGYIDLPGQKRIVFALFINHSLKPAQETSRVLHSKINTILLQINNQATL